VRKGTNNFLNKPTFYKIKIIRLLAIGIWLIGTPTLVKAQVLLGVTGGGRSALYWGRTCGALLGSAES